MSHLYYRIPELDQEVQASEITIGFNEETNNDSSTYNQGFQDSHLKDKALTSSTTSLDQEVGITFVAPPDEGMSKFSILF